MGRDEFNPKSVDAMFATVLAEQKAMREAMTARFDAQAQELAAIRAQTEKTDGRVDDLEKREAERRTRFTTLAGVFSVLGAGLVKIADWIVSGPPNP